MATGKQVAQEILNGLPDDCSVEDVQYHLSVRQMIEQGREEVRQGRFYSQEEIERDIAQWLGE